MQRQRALKGNQPGASKMGISSQKPCQAFFAGFGKLFFAPDLLESSNIGTRILSGLELLGLLGQAGNCFVQQANRLGGRRQGFWCRGFRLEGGFEGWLFHGWDDANHVLL